MPPCAACKFLRRKCTPECVFAPYFPSDQPKRFSDVHRVFGASNVSKILNELDAAHREDAVQSLAYEADCRIRDPVYGCVGQISHMQKTVAGLRMNLEDSKRELASLVGPEMMEKLIHDPVIRAKYHPQGVTEMPNFSSSVPYDPRTTARGYKLMQEYQRQEQLRQAQQRQQIGARIMHQMLVTSERNNQLKKQQELLQQQQQQQGYKQQLLDSQMQAALQEEQTVYKTYEDLHREAELYVMQQQREAELSRLREVQEREAQLMRYHQEQQQQRRREAQLMRHREQQRLRGQIEVGTSSRNAELSPLLALGNGFVAMNPYQLQEQPLLNPYHFQSQEQQHPTLVLHQPQEIINIPDDNHQHHQQEQPPQQQQEIQDFQLFPGQNLSPPEPENGG